MTASIVPETKRVGFAQRALAYIIDNFFISLVAILLINFFSPETLRIFSQSQDIMKMLLSPPDSLSGNQKEIIQAIAAFNSYLSAVSILYMLTEAYSGASPGKRLLSLQITDLNGRICPTKRYILRYTLKNLSGLSYILSTSLGIGFILSFGQFFSTIIFVGFFLTLNAQAMGFHDMIAGTVVIRRKDLQPSGGENASGN